MKFLKVFLLNLFLIGGVWAVQASWNSTGGTVPDANWSGDTTPMTGNTNVGALVGDAGVSGGSASYRIPIKVVPGRKGMQPEVTLAYSSDVRNGIAGVGWQLSATGAISRCGKTVAQDGLNDKVHYLKAKDRLCLNGQRLIAVSGAYGNSGTEYRTELNTFAKIKQTGDMDGLNTWFEVIHKNGYRDFYGQTTDSRHSPGIMTKTLSWNLNKSSDVSGNNTITYSYMSHGNGEYTLNAIHYTGQGSSVGDRHVEFSYESRPDTSTSYQSGGLSVSSKRLKTITTKYKTTTVRQYRLSYKLSATSSNSLLSTAQECAYDGSTARCLPATQFNWYENAPVYKLEKLQYSNASGAKFPIGPTATINHVLPKKDMNGDGTLDWSVAFVDSEGEYKGPNNYENLGSCYWSIEINGTRCFETDFNNDGLTDSWDMTHGSPRIFRYSYTNSNGTASGFVNSAIRLYKSGYVQDQFLGMADLNGDGYTDILVKRMSQSTSTNYGNARVEVFLHTKNHAAPYPSVGKFVYNIPTRRIGYSWNDNEAIQLLGDFDGNGIDDIFIFQLDVTEEPAPDQAAYFHKPRFKQVLFSQPSTSNYVSTSQTYGHGFTYIDEDAGTLPNYHMHEQLYDLNGDGLLDLLSIGWGGLFGAMGGYNYQINLGNGQLSSMMFMQGDDVEMRNRQEKGYAKILRNGDSPFTGGFDPIAPVTTRYAREPRLIPNFTLDYDQDGVSELLIPYERVVSHCFDHGVEVNLGQWQVQRLCDDDMYRVGESLLVNQGPIGFNNDRSLYKYHKAVFSVTGYQNSVPIISVSLEPTEIVSSVSEGTARDVFGNGQTDFLTMVSCVTAGSNCTYGGANGTKPLSAVKDAYNQPLVPGAYINRNVGSYGASSNGPQQYEVTDKLKSVVTALNQKTEWDYLPLNSGQRGAGFYQVNHAALASTADYLHFGANFNVVSEMRQSNGINGLNSIRYSYVDATLNTAGRGFQGFKQIKVDDIANNLHTETDYHVIWPKSGQVERNRTWRIGDNYSGASISENSINYQVLTNQTSFVVTKDSTTITRDLKTKSELYREKVTYTYDSYGNQTRIDNLYYEPGNKNRNETVTTNTFATPDTTNWWVDKLNSQIVLTKVVQGRASDYASVESGTDTQKQLKTSYTWNNLHRLPATVITQTVQGGGRPTRVTKQYNLHGLPISVNLEGSSYSSNSYNLTDRVVKHTYTPDGYFVASNSNAKNHVTYFTIDPKHGVATLTTDPNGRTISTAYDAFGRIKSKKLSGEPTQYLGYWWCSGDNGGAAWCPSASLTSYRTILRQKGQPDHYRYFDSENREVDSLIRNFSNSNWIRQQRSYDARGQLNWESQPFDNSNWSTRKITYYRNYDELGRVGRKDSPQSDYAGSSTTAGSNMITTYTHTGMVTAINVSHAGSVLNMERKYNGLNQLVYTKDANAKYTRYAYDGSGNPISILDAKNNRITSQYNALGQKNWVRDPNSGFRQFWYNSLGELELEKDANNDRLLYNYDQLGRMTLRRKQFNSAGSWIYTGVWYYDGSGQAHARKGKLYYEYNINTNTDRLIKYYYYATTPQGKDYLSYIRNRIYENGAYKDYLTYHYVDTNYGRPKGIKYGATGLTLAFDYNALGYMTKTKNAASGYVYRDVKQQDHMGNVISSELGVQSGVATLTQNQAYHAATGQMKWNRIMRVSNGSTVHELEYDYKQFSNLQQSIVTASNGQQNYETYTYDSLHRLIRSERAYSSVSRGNDVINYAYDATGNLTYKSDYAQSYSYGNAARTAGGNAGPNAVRAIQRTGGAGGGSTSYVYDNNGNMLLGDGRAVTYDVFNRPLTINTGLVTSQFSYGADGDRYKQVKTGGSEGTVTTYYIDRLLEKEVSAGKTIYRHYIDDVAVINKENSTWKMGFNLQDRLGSVVTLTDQTGNVIEHRSYDPFGKPRRGDFLDVTPRASDATLIKAITQDPHQEASADPHTNRGFTDHEHLDDHKIIHMNGRVYDYNLGRFASVDPYVQAPLSTQSVNAYSYIMNNPLAGTDPTGYQSCDEGDDCDEPEVEVEKVAVTGSRLKTGTKYSDGNGNSVTTNQHNQVVSVTGSLKAVQGAIQRHNESVSGSSSSSAGSNDDAESLGVSVWKQEKALKQCLIAAPVSCGGLSQAKVQSLQGNPAGTSKADQANPNLVDNVTVNADGSVDIDIAYYPKGDQSRVADAVKNIRREYAKQDINVSFTPVGTELEADLIVHGAALEDMVGICLAQTCEAALGIGGYAPFPGKGEYKDKLLMLNNVGGGKHRLTDAHEFGHKLGLRHRTDGGIMDYPPKDPNKYDKRKVTPNDADRIRNLYK